MTEGGIREAEGGRRRGELGTIFLRVETKPTGVSDDSSDTPAGVRQ